ncbi:MAG: hypothetical protein H0W72_15030 [Planctomycetes bacterium]|nr:hypothetical protein [Planctomycetota bacterium]
MPRLNPARLLVLSVLGLFLTLAAGAGLSALRSPVTDSDGVLKPAAPDPAIGTALAAFPWVFCGFGACFVVAVLWYAREETRADR